MVKVSVIVPIYNVEHFIEHCVTTLMQQTLDGVEYIFVDDATPDDSIQILETVLKQYPERSSCVRILHHKENKGLPAARNTGLRVATGKYIYHCDSDDFMEPDVLKRLYDAAEEHKADYVWCDYYIASKKGNEYRPQPGYTTVEQALQGMLCGEVIYNVWNKLLLRELYEKNCIVFPEGCSMGEDMTMIILLSCASKIVHIPYGGYYYVTINPIALTKKYVSEKNVISLKCNIIRISKFISERFGNKFDYEINIFKLNLKWAFLAFSSHISTYKLWHEWFPEANAYIPLHHVSLRMKFVEWCASKRLFWLVKLHYLIVIRLFYRVVGK